MALKKRSSTQKTGAAARDAKLKKALDEAMPMGTHASFHRDANAIESLFARKAGDLQNPLGGNPVGGNVSTGSSQFVGRTPMLYVDPMFDPILFLFPKDRIDEINKRLRHYYETDPIVGSALDMHCLPPGEPVYCNGGIKNIQDIIIGDTVVGTKGKLVKVTGSESIQYDGDIYEIKPRYLPSIKVTDTHPIMAIPKDSILYDSHGTPHRTDTNRPHHSKAKWIMAKSIKDGDIILFPKFNTFSNQDPIDLVSTLKNKDKYVYDMERISTIGKKGSCPRIIRWSNELSELLGWYVAEGSTYLSTVTFSLGSHERVEAKRISSLVSAVFGLETALYEKKNNGIQITFFSTPIASMLNEICGIGSSKKKVPNGILLGCVENANSFLSAYLKGDGCFSKGNDNVRQVQCCTVSRELSYQLLLLGSKCGFLFCHTLPTNGIRNGKQQLYQLSAHKNYIRKVLVSSGPDMELEEYPRTNSFFHQDEDYFYIKILRVGREKFKGIVYDIKTEDESFCAPFLVHNTSFPLSDYYLECEDPENQAYWNDHKERTGQIEFLRQLTHDHWLVGEGIGLPIWDEYNLEFSHYNQYPPENVDIVQSYVTPRKYFMLKPDPKLAEKTKSGAKLDEALTKMMDPAYVKSLEEGKAYLLGSDEKVMYLARTTTKYRARGISILGRVLKDLLYKDKLRLLQLTFVDRHMFPIKIFKLGSETKGWIPNKKHFQRLDALLKQAANDPDFNILYHFGLTVDYVGTKDKIHALIPEFQWVESQIMAGLFVNEEIVHGGMPSTVRDTVNMRTLMHRYTDLREKIERMMITHIFLPTARARGMYRKGRKAAFIAQEEKLTRIAGKDVIIKGEFLDKEKKFFRVANSHCGAIDLSVYDIPRPIWKKMNLVNNAAEQQLLMALEADGKIPLEMVLDLLGLDPRIVKKKLHDQESTPFDPLWRENRESVGRDKAIRLQILQGKKFGDWKLDDGEKLDETPSQAPQKKTSPPPSASSGGAAPAQPPIKDKAKPGDTAPGALPQLSSPAQKTPVTTTPPAAGTPPPSMAAPGPVPGSTGEV